MMRALLTTLLTGLILAAAALPAGAFTFLDRSYGTPELGISPRSRAMGGAGSALGTGAYSLVDNPGALLLAPGNRVQLQGFLGRASENRFVPLFDTFDSYVDETAIAVNDNVYGAVQGGLVLRQWGETGIVVAAGLFDRYDPRYDYLDELRDRNDEIVNNGIIHTDGVIHEAVVGLAVPLGQEGSGFGAAVNYYFGEVNDRVAIVENPTSPDATVSEDARFQRKLDGVSVTLGVLAEVNERLRLGASVETGAQLEDDYTQWQDGDLVSPEISNGDLDLPLRVQGGVAYRPRNAYRTTFALDVVYMPWSDLEDHLAPDLKLEDTWDVRFGLEHVFYNDLPARIGFRYAESYALDEADQATFTFGFGYVLRQLRLDLAGEVGKRNSRQVPLRSRDEDEWSVGNGMDRVEDTLLRVTFGVDYLF